MSKQVMQRALDAVTCTDQMPYETWMRMHGEPVAEELRAEIAKPEVEPVAGVVLRDGWPTLTRFIQETDTRLFTAPPDTEAMRRDAERYEWFANIAVSGDFEKAEKAFACFEFAESCTRQEIDAAIDAAIDKQGGTP